MFLLLSFPPRVSAMSSDGNPLQFLSLVLKFVGFISTITILYMSEVSILHQYTMVLILYFRYQASSKAYKSFSTGIL